MSKGGDLTFHTFFHIVSCDMFLISFEAVANELPHYTATPQTEFYTKIRRVSLVTISKYLGIHL
jgi:hypothetical protein